MKNFLFLITLFLFSFCSTQDIKNPIVDELSEQVDSFQEKTRNFVKTKYSIQEDKSQACEELLTNGSELTSKLKKEILILNKENINFKKENSSLSEKADRYDWWRNRIIAAFAILVAWEFRSFIWKFIQKAML